MAFFDYTTFLMESTQIEKAKIAALCGSTTAGDYYPYYDSELFTNPSDQQMFHSIINPGHAGITSLITYSLWVTWTAATGSYRWQIKASGGTWVDLPGASGTLSTLASRDTGIYTTAVLLPAEIQLLGTRAAGTLGVDGIGYLVPCSVRCIGTV